ncbi:Transferase, hexapeptide repeat family [Sulfurovum sp. enrichment culture clone C5]|uniref:Transferase, hexapeptide repeat family n=1 Tax=Sulfurovum sp. enrichment culture clone C5 TaxID=497650 RepID=A0A0S4XPV5_9BACT|nr:Transferase, hexapeptide repeat family [Sulfurovum sp. enrichment culture clone C5]
MVMNFQNYTPKIGENAFIAHSADVIGRVEMGKDSAAWFGVVIRGDVHYIKIGDRSNIQDLSMVHVTHYKKDDMSDGYPTIIGNDVTVGHRVMLHGCTIEDACLIGMSATILDGAVIGKESIVGAGALVTKNKIFPPRSLIMGSPAKVVRELNDDEVAELYASAARYVKFKNEYAD